MLEYKIISLEPNTAEETLNRYGIEGWRLVSTSPNVAKGNGIIAFLEKERSKGLYILVLEKTDCCEGKSRYEELVYFTDRYAAEEYGKDEVKNNMTCCSYEIRELKIKN